MNGTIPEEYDLESALPDNTRIHVNSVNEGLESIVNGNVTTSIETEKIELPLIGPQQNIVFFPSYIEKKTLKEKVNPDIGRNDILITHIPPRFYLTNEQKGKFATVDSQYHGEALEDIKDIKSNDEPIIKGMIIDYDLADFLIEQRKKRIRLVKRNLGSEVVKKYISSYGVRRVISGLYDTSVGAAHTFNPEERIRKGAKTYDLYLNGSNLNRGLNVIKGKEGEIIEEYPGIISRIRVYFSGEIDYELIKVPVRDYIIEYIRAQQAKMPRIVYNFTS